MIIKVAGTAGMSSITLDTEEKFLSQQFYFTS